MINVFNLLCWNILWCLSFVWRLLWEIDSILRRWPCWLDRPLHFATWSPANEKERYQRNLLSIKHMSFFYLLKGVDDLVNLCDGLCFFFSSEIGAQLPKWSQKLRLLSHVGLAALGGHGRQFQNLFQPIFQVL